MKNTFNKDYLIKLTSICEGSGHKLDQAHFIKVATKNLESLEMRQRIKQFGECFFDTFNRDYPAFCQWNLAYFDANPPQNAGVDWKQGCIWEVSAYIVEKYGLSDWNLSMKMLEEITKRYTSEFAVRPYIESNTEKTLNRMEQWAQSDNEHLRRLASEGSRSRLPWGKKLLVMIQNPELSLNILEHLKNDPSLYVRRSVANHINDMSKDNGKVAYSLLQQWKQNATPHTLWIINHALRYQLKLGNPEALKILNLNQAFIKIERFEVSPKRLSFPGTLTFNLLLESKSNSAQNLVIDLIIHWVRKGNTRTQKTFKAWKITLPAAATQSLSKYLKLVPITTRNYYSGEHRVELMINGEVKAEAYFDLLR